VAKTFSGNVIEFLVGWWVLPRIFFFVFAFIFAYLTLDPAQTLIYTKIAEGTIIVILFFFRKAVALGYLLDFVLSFIGVYGILTGKA